MITDKCGYHCGIITSGSARFEGHCNCRNCHNGNAPNNVTTILDRD